MIHRLDILYKTDQRDIFNFIL